VLFLLHLFNVLAILRAGVLRVDARLEDSVKECLVGENERVKRMCR